MKKFFSILVLVIFLATTGCAGYRRGVASVPFVGDVEPALKTPETTYELGELKRVQLPGVTLDISLNNTIRTSDVKVMLFVVPMSFSHGDKPYFGETDKLTIRLTIIPADPGFVFDPSCVVVTIDGQPFRPITTRLDDPAKRSAYWRSSSPASDDPSLWSDLVDKRISLIKGNYHTLTMIFDCPVPTPDRSIRLDIGQALLHQNRPNIPTIRFMKIRWKQGYT